MEVVWLSVSLSLINKIITEDWGGDQSPADVLPAEADQHTELAHDLARAEEHLQSADWALGVEQVMVGHGAGQGRLRSDQRNFPILSTYRVTLSQARTVTGRRNRSKFSNSS